MSHTNSSQSQGQTQSSYEPSTYSVSTTYSSKPILTSSEENKDSKRSSKVWKKTKSLLKKLGEPPTAEHDRQQVAEGKPAPDTSVYHAPTYGGNGLGGNQLNKI